MPSAGGSVVALWRYPVSSMAGERLDSARVNPTGFAGDRLWGVFDRGVTRIAWPGREPRSQNVPRGHARISNGQVEISADGETWNVPTDGVAQSALSDVFGFPAEFRPYAGVDDFQPRYSRAPVHLLTTASLRTLRALLPGSIIDERRFRPNIVVDIGDGASAIPENDWLGREIKIGDVVLRPTIPAGRCGFTMLEQDGLPLDAEVLRTITRNFGRNFGIYCDVIAGGDIRIGDRLAVAPNASA